MSYSGPKTMNPRNLLPDDPTNKKESQNVHDPQMLRPSLAAAVQWSSQTPSRPTSEGMVGRVYSSATGKAPAGGGDLKINQNANPGRYIESDEKN